MNIIDFVDTEHTKPLVLSNICKTAKINTNEGKQYKWKSGQYEHNAVKHACGEYVHGDAYTNTIEGAFGHFKRSIIGVYHQASDKYINRYLNMFAWHWSSRDIGESEGVNALLVSIVGRTLTYRAFIGK